MIVSILLFLFLFLLIPLPSADLKTFLFPTSLITQHSLPPITFFPDPTPALAPAPTQP